MLLRFKQFESKKTFVPKRIQGRDEEAEKKGIKNYLRMAQKGLLKNLDWRFDNMDAINADFDSNSDPRVSVYITEFEHLNDEVLLTMSLCIQWDDYLDDPNKGPYQLQISDDNGESFFEQFDTFEEGFKKLEEYLGRKPKHIGKKPKSLK